MTFNLSKTNDEAAALTAVGAFVGGMALAHLNPVAAAEYAVLAGLAVLGYTGYTPVVPAAPAA